MKQQRLALVLSVVALAAACGGSDGSSAPTTPVGTSTAIANGTSGTTSADGKGTTTASTGIVGTISELTGGCPTLTFKLEAKVIKTDAATLYGEAISCAALKNTLRVGVSGVAQADGSVLAKVVKVAPALPAPLPAPVVLEGTVSALSGSCPNVTFTVATRSVTTDSNTRFGDLGCAAVKNDAKVAVATQVQANGSVRVLAVKVIPPPPPPPPPPAILGAVTTVIGTCPAITITVGTKVALTSASTVFDGKKCGDIKPGVTVGIYGSIAAGATTLTATKVVSPR